jgi:Icc-related predicted phosphoesterase
MARISIIQRLLIQCVSIFSILALLGCNKTEKTGPAASPAQEQVAKAPAGPKALTQESDPKCVGPFTTEPAKELEIAGVKYTQNGAVLNQVKADEDNEMIIGHLTDIKEGSPANIANINLFMDWFAEKKVELIAVTGDLSESQEGIEAILNAIGAKTKVPVLVVIGNRECENHFNAALTAVNKTHPNILNMDLIRVLNTDDVSIVSMPGYYNPSYLHCTKGCRYFDSDVANLKTIAERAVHPTRVLISHGPPRMEGATGIDRIHDEANVGDPALASFMKTNVNLFPLGLFGNVQEAGGRATDLKGTPIAEQTMANQLYLNSGPADAMRFSMLGGKESLGMAGILKIKGQQAQYEIRKIKAGEAKAPQ